jgi:hypothetical protein
MGYHFGPAAPTADIRQELPDRMSILINQDSIIDYKRAQIPLNE